MTADDQFFAWLDGELGPAEAAAMEAKVASDPELARLAAQHRALGYRLKSAFDPVAAQPIPERLQAAVRPSAEVIPIAAGRRARSVPAAVQWSALAATLAVGIVVGTMVPERASAPIEVQGGKLYAAASLNQALDTKLASAPSGDVRIGLTFRDKAGAVCRSFTAAAASGVACRADGRWHLEGLFAAPEGQEGAYRMAAGMDPNLAALVETRMAGEPFDQAQEKAAKERGWK